MTDIFEEVDQSLREDTFATWWKRWQWLIYGLVAVAILGVAGLEIYRGIRAEEINKAAVIYDAGFAAQEKNDLTTARASFAQLETDKTGFKALAGHMLAGVEKELTNDTAAVEAHLSAAAAADKGVMGDLAIIKLAYLKADTGTLAEVEAVLKPLLDRTGQASALARELIGAKALAEGNVERARSEFEALALDLEAPQGVQRRVQQALSTLPARKIDLDAPATPAATPAPAAPAATPAPATPSPAQAPQ
ncbi:MAG TPA: tetratricopeptide repeat protein [Hyphomonadaceae bacterium]|nr:tetratricopeptide repeat protein [Hyphomonadaceae bacterium]HPI48732.1 tetratricopeptide repeat protein [Hyphomonadaceae bacterium]